MKQNKEPTHIVNWFLAKGKKFIQWKKDTVLTNVVEKIRCEYTKTMNIGTYLTS